MSTLVNRNPRREMLTLHQTLDQFFNKPLMNMPAIWNMSATWENPEQDLQPAMDIVENKKGYTVSASLPGIAPEDIEITLDDNMLTVRAEISKEQEREGERVHIRERSYGKFVRQVRIPVAVDTDQVEATNEHGVLNIFLPKLDTTKSKRIVISNKVELTN